MDWHGCRLYSPGWNDPSSRVLAFTMGGFAKEGSPEDEDLHVMLNMEWEDLDFDIPPIDGRQWYRVADTALSSPDDIVGTEQALLISGNTYRLQKHSVVVLISR
jgi:isoamylase